ncbi:hypothetical protein F2Q69_00023084 [Brassica cretica]|uniref:Uncharacterized protein n=1 Tax=Brassica cretica TaxID=69181 RepID=A0A8S9QD64_BRACR|nr:hypothetical protein F2Q69_00023084 [Brassica cretica]
MSTHTLQAKGRRSTVALPERTEAHWECRPGAKSKHIAPYARDTKVIGKADGEGHQHPGTSMSQKITKGKYLRPAKSTRNCRTTRPTKVLLPRCCPIDLEGTPNGSTEGNMCYLDNSPRLIDIESGPSPEDRVRCCIKSIKTLGSRQQNKYSPPSAISTGPTGSEHEALKSLRFKGRIIRDYEFLHDVRRYLRVVRRRIDLHTSTKDLVPPVEGMRKITVFTRLLPSIELLHPRVRAKYVAMHQRGPAPGRHISLITAMRIQDQEFLLPSGATDHLQQISTNTSDLHQPNLRVLPSIDMQGQDPESSWVNRPKPATSLGIFSRPLSISGKSTLLKVQTRPMPKKTQKRRLKSDVLFTPSPKDLPPTSRC